MYTMEYFTSGFECDTSWGATTLYGDVGELPNEPFVYLSGSSLTWAKTVKPKMSIMGKNIEFFELKTFLYPFLVENWDEQENCTTEQINLKADYKGIRKSKFAICNFIIANSQVVINLKWNLRMQQLDVLENFYSDFWKQAIIYCFCE